MAARETINVNGKVYRKFIPYPETVRDGTARCWACGQIDEPGYHVPWFCPAMMGPSPTAPDAPRSGEDK